MMCGIEDGSADLVVEVFEDERDIIEAVDLEIYKLS
jgi:hypothetical protein